MSAPYQVELEVFEGPLDLLLHLIRKHELDIFEIPISFITERYLSYLETMRALNLDVAGEYLLMAATLAHLKSRELLPTPEAEPGDEAADEGGDPRQELIRRLLEYQKYKQAGALLGERPVLGRNVWVRSALPDPAALGEPTLAEVSVFKLIEALQSVLARAQVNLAHDVVVDRVSIADQIHELCDRLELESSFTFESCFAISEAPDELSLRNRVVATFLALLEMTRLRMIRLHQPAGSPSIYITRAAADLDAALRSFHAEEYSG